MSYIQLLPLILTLICSIDSVTCCRPKRDGESR